MTDPNHHDRPPTPGAGPNQPPSDDDDPVLVLARAGDWRTLADIGRFGLAAQTLRLTGTGDADTLDALQGLSEVEHAVRAKAIARARTRLTRIDPRPADLVDWAGIEADLEALATAMPAVDRRELPEARAALDTLRTDVFAAERDALIGTMAVLEGDTEAGLAAFEATLVRDPNHVRALTNRGNVKLEAGDVDGAIADYERAIKIDDTFANAHHNLGVAYRRKGQVGKSVAALRRAQRQVAKRDAEDARASLAGRRGGGGGTPRRWRRWLVIAVLVGAALWWMQRSGMI
jgi:tetratricopeptide (TPR) repeat protein